MQILELSLKQRPTKPYSFPAPPTLKGIVIMMMVGKRMYYRAEVTPSLTGSGEPVDFMGDK